MKITIEIPDFDGNALDVIWDAGSKYEIQNVENTIVLSANNNGLISFAKQMLYLAYNEVQKGSHIHYDEFFTQVPSNFELIIEKKTGDGTMS